MQKHCDYYYGHNEKRLFFIQNTTQCSNWMWCRISGAAAAAASGSVYTAADVGHYMLNQCEWTGHCTDTHEKKHDIVLSIVECALRDQNVKWCVAEMKTTKLNSLSLSLAYTQSHQTRKKEITIATDDDKLSNKPGMAQDWTICFPWVTQRRHTLHTHLVYIIHRFDHCTTWERICHVWTHQTHTIHRTINGHRWYFDVWLPATDDVCVCVRRYWWRLNYVYQSTTHCTVHTMPSLIQYHPLSLTSH